MSPRLLRPHSRGVSTALPLTIAGLEAWWDAADSASVTLDSGRISEWRDKSGKGRHAANSTSGSTQPDYISAGRNGLNVARFAAASSQRLSVASSTAAFNFLHDGTLAYVAFVAFWNTLVGNRALISNNGFSSSSRGITVAQLASSARFAVSVTTANSGVVPINTLIAGYNNTAKANELVVVEVILDPGNATAANRLDVKFGGTAITKANASTGTPSASNASADLFIGSRSGGAADYMDGDICELLMYSQHPTAAAQTAIRQYLGTKWGVTVT